MKRKQEEDACGAFMRGRWPLFSPTDIKKSFGVSKYKVIKSLCINISHDCNMRCAYCFASEITGLSAC